MEPFKDGANPHTPGGNESKVVEERTSDARPVNIGAGVVEGVALDADTAVLVALEAALGSSCTSAEFEI